VADAGLAPTTLAQPPAIAQSAHASEDLIGEMEAEAVGGLAQPPAYEPAFQVPVASLVTGFQADVQNNPYLQVSTSFQLYNDELPEAAGEEVLPQQRAPARPKPAPSQGRDHLFQKLAKEEKAANRIRNDANRKGIRNKALAQMPTTDSQVSSTIMSTKQSIAPAKGGSLTVKHESVTRSKLTSLTQERQEVLQDRSSHLLARNVDGSTPPTQYRKLGQKLRREAVNRKQNFQKTLAKNKHPAYLKAGAYQ